MCTFLSVGGMLVLFILGIDDGGCYTGKTRGHDVFQPIADCWTDLLKQGMITEVKMFILL